MVTLLLRSKTLLSASHCGRETYFMSDGSDLSTPDLIRTIARLERSVRLVPVSPILLRMPGRTVALAGGLVPVRSSWAVSGLAGSLAIDIRKISKAAGYRPPFTPDQGLQVTSQWYQSRSPR
jgi:UDP-N-acetyl-alpha-D-quinovosamine dehydrogenase